VASVLAGAEATAGAILELRSELDMASSVERLMLV
jgi:hypothetical protein